MINAICRLSLTELAVGSVALGALAEVVHGTLAPSELEAASAPTGVVLLTVLWAGVLIGARLAFPRIRMTRFVVTQAAPVAAAISILNVVFLWIIDGLGLHLVAGWVASAIFLTPIVTLVLFVPERRRMKRRSI